MSTDTARPENEQEQKVEENNDDSSRAMNSHHIQDPEDLRVEKDNSRLFLMAEHINSTEPVKVAIHINVDAIQKAKTVSNGLKNASQ